MDEQARNEVPQHVGALFWGYLWLVSVAGFAVLAGVVSARHEHLPAVLTTVAFWTILVLILRGEARPMVTASMTDTAGIVTSGAFVFAALLIFGLPVAALLHVLAAVLSGMLRRQAWWRTCFNAGQYTLSLASAGLVLWALGHDPAVTAAESPGAGHVVALALAAAAYSITNHLLVWSAVSLTSGAPLASVIRKDIRYQLAVDVSLFSVGILTAVVMAAAPYLVLLFVVPLVAVSRVGAASADQERLALTDQLTGLANRSALRAAADEAHETSRRTGERFALLALDLDRFKQINDTLGHHVGDEVLRITASRLTGAVRSGDTVARLGGDEFAILLPDITGDGSPAEVTARLRVLLDDPVVVDGHVLRVATSVGAALFPSDGEDLETLLRAADRAMYADKLLAATAPAAPALADSAAAAL